MYKTTLKIDGMMCGMCEAHINDVIRKTIKGAQNIKSSHTKGESTFVSQEKADEESLKKAIAGTGYELKDLQVEEYEKKRFSLFG